MSWPIAGDWLTVMGLILLTFGTGAQAWGNLAEFRSIRRTVSEVASSMMTDRLATGVDAIYARSLEKAIRAADGDGDRFRQSYRQPSKLAVRILLLRAHLATMVMLPGKLRELRAEGGDEAVQLARFLPAGGGLGHSHDRVCPGACSGGHPAALAYQ